MSTTGTAADREHREPAHGNQHRLDQHRLDQEHLEQLRGELVGYCYRMLGSPFEAEDAVQEALLRAWRHRDRYDPAKGSPRTWVYRIATNVCLDMRRSGQRRARATDLGPASALGSALGPPLPETAFVQPAPDAWALPEAGDPARDPGADPAELAVRRDTIRLAFLAALQHLAPRQRAVLILREVLCWSALETAQVLDTTVASVNSALQRARARLREAQPGTGTHPSTGDRYDPTNPEQRRLLASYCDAFHRHDVPALVALLREDATMSMPPFTWWLRGRDTIAAAMAVEHSCANARLLPTVANGSPAFGQYRPTGPDGTPVPFALVVLELTGGRISGITNYLDPERLFPLFGLPEELPATTDESTASVSY